MTNMIILISSAIIGYAAQQRLTLALIPVSALMIFLGIYGIVFSQQTIRASSTGAKFGYPLDKTN
jgi:hypothetical protein